MHFIVIYASVIWQELFKLNAQNYIELNVYSFCNTVNGFDFDYFQSSEYNIMNESSELWVCLCIYSCINRL